MCKHEARYRYAGGEWHCLRCGVVVDEPFRVSFGAFLGFLGYAITVIALWIVITIK